MFRNLLARLGLAGEHNPEHRDRRHAEWLLQRNGPGAASGSQFGPGRGRRVHSQT